MKGLRAERIILSVGVLLFALTLVSHQGPIPWRQSPFFVPTGLVVLSIINSFLRAKGLAWGIFTAAFVVFMIILGTWVVMDRAMKGPPATDFLRSIALYGFLATGALMQLRVSSSKKEFPPHEKN